MLSLIITEYLILSETSSTRCSQCLKQNAKKKKFETSYLLSNNSGNRLYVSIIIASVFIQFESESPLTYIRLLFCKLKSQCCFWEMFKIVCVLFLGLFCHFTMRVKCRLQQYDAKDARFILCYTLFIILKAVCPTNKDFSILHSMCIGILVVQRQFCYTYH